jgi:integrase/recombinase XerD
MSTLVEQMQMDMEIMNYSQRTIRSYRAHIKAFLRYFDKSAEELEEDDIRKYLYYLKAEKQFSSSNISQAFSAIKFLYRAVLKMPVSLSKLRGPRRTYRLPVVLSYQEVRALLGAVKNFKHQTILMAIYSAGLRLSEAAQLRVSDIDSQRMQLRVTQSKGRKDRYTVLSKVLLEQLRRYYRQYRPEQWLFYGRDKSMPISNGTIQRVFHDAKKKQVSASRPQFTPYATALRPIF